MILRAFSVHCSVALICTFICSVTAVEIVDDLKLVQLIFRHGDRAPIHTFKNDPYGAKIWDNGLARLTAKGMKQQLHLGQFFKQRYSKFLDPVNGPNQVYIRSTDTDRTLQSANAFAAGLLPPNGNQLWDDALGKLWRPVSVHSVQYEKESLLSIEAKCPNYELLVNDTWKMPVPNKLYRENKAVFDLLIEKSGEEASSKKKAWEVLGHVHDVVFCQKSAGYALPNWMNQSVFDRIHQIHEVMFHVNAGANGDKERARLVGGQLLALIEKRMKDVIENRTAEKDRDYKMFVYSGHDTSISGILSVLRLYDYNETSLEAPIGQPGYASTVIIELFKNNSVRISYKNDLENILTKDPTVLTHPACSVFCPFDKFVEVTREFVVEDWNKECIGPGFLGALDVADIEVGLVIIVLVIVLTTFALGCWKRRSKSAPRTDPELNGTVVYSRLQEEIDQDDSA